jgi:hypothetical protein
MVVEKPYQQDVTVHDPQYHTILGITHTPEWYGLFGNICPDCKQPVKFETVLLQETVPDPPKERSKPKQKISARANIKSKKESK